MGFCHWLATARLDNHVSEGKAREVLSHVISHISPDAEQNTLTLMVTRSILMRLTEVSGGDRSIHGSDDLRQRYGLCGSSEHIAAPNASFRAHEPDSLQAEQDLLEVGLGESGALGEVAHRRG